MATASRWDRSRSSTASSSAAVPKPGPRERADVVLTASLEEPEPKRAAPDPDTPFRILMLGDFSGRASRGVEEPDSLGFDRLPIRIDRDNLDDVMAELHVELQLRLEGGSAPAITLRFGALDDFHPDRVYEQAHAFSRLRRLRESLDDDDPSRYEEATAEIRSWGFPDPDEAMPSAPAEPAAPEKGEREGQDLVAEMLERASPREQGDSLDAFLRKVVQPYLLSQEAPDRQGYIEKVETAVGSWMRDILHRPAFQALESAWRAADFLVRRLETDGALQVFLLDVSKEELAAGLKAADTLEATSPYRLLVEQTVGTPGADPWSVLAGLYSFDRTLEDVALLGRLATVARAAGAPFLAAAKPRVLGCESLAKTPDPDDWGAPSDDPQATLWEALRTLPGASFLGLALPRLLLRLPYGKETDPVEKFDFEEWDEDAKHEDYLWGNPAVACATLLGQEFSRYGWHLRPGMARDLAGLPLHTHRREGVAKNQPCAEVLLGDRAAERILEAGLMPVVSMRDRDTIRVVRFQSIADPPAPLSGPWG